MFKISVGSSCSTDAAEAVGDAIAQCLANLGFNTPKAGILLNEGHVQDASLLRAVTDTWPQMPLIGAASEVPGNERRLTLLLLDSPDLNFHLGVGRKNGKDAHQAAEEALSQSAQRVLDQISLCLTLPDESSDWHYQFNETIRRLLPGGVTYLNELLPVDNQGYHSGLTRYYCGNKVLLDSTPILLATTADEQDQGSGWSLTRQHGILRKTYGNRLYVYDTFAGDRRRISRAS